MRNTSDIIEQFILEVLGAHEKLELSRNELATFFSCAPSQINYVLQTRFTPERGFVTESRRGIGGSITVIRLSSTLEDAYGRLLGAKEDEGLSMQKAAQVTEKLLTDGIITEREAAILKAVMSDKTLVAPSAVKDNLRMCIIKAVLVELIKD